MIESSTCSHGAQRQRCGKRKRRHQCLRPDDEGRSEIERQPGVVAQYGACADLHDTERDAREKSGARAVHCNFPGVATFNRHPNTGRRPREHLAISCFRTVVHKTGLSFSLGHAIVRRNALSSSASTS